ncbi:MAG: sugar phosphate isomerase/epimerase [Balneolales bacterium]|nr:sugar phosphate isomerase/epimerase [Balneolales bacterium]
MGFDYIETYGLGTDGLFFGSMTPAELKQMANNAGMRITSTHCDYFSPAEAPVIAEAANTLESDYVVLPWLSEERRANYLGEAENFNLIGEAFKGSGVRFAYHNHDFEFFKTENGEIPMELLIENTDAALVDYQADLYWIKKAGFDPVEFISKYPGRFCSYHIKDANEDLDQTTIGAGIIDFETILSKNAESGIKYVFIEDERTDDPLANIKAGHDYLRSISF